MPSSLESRTPPTERERELFHESLERCRLRSGFVDRFYELFVDSSPEVKAKFEGTDMKRQARALRRSFYVLIRASENDSGAIQELEEIAKKHDRGHRDIGPHLYARWLDALLQTVREYDPHLTEEALAAWRSILQRGIDFLVARY